MPSRQWLAVSSMTVCTSNSWWPISRRKGCIWLRSGRQWSPYRGTHGGSRRLSPKGRRTCFWQSNTWSIPESIRLPNWCRTTSWRRAHRTEGWSEDNNCRNCQLVRDKKERWEDRSKLTCWWWSPLAEEFADVSEILSGLWKYKYLMQWVAPTQLAVTHIVTHTPK